MEAEESPGAAEAIRDMGLDPAHVRGGWLKTKEASIQFRLPDAEADPLADYAELVREAFADLPRETPTPAPVADADLLTKYVIADLHLGMHAWAQEAGEDYDIGIAERSLLTATRALVDRSPASGTGLILNLGDTFHANDAKNMTPGSGHILDVDSRFARIAMASIRAIKAAINAALAKHERVVYACVAGNHDPDQSHWLTLALMEAYADEPRVSVEWCPGKLWAMQHGRNLIAAHHGDRVKPDRLAMFLADQHAEKWGATYWRFLDTGHIHHESSKDIGGVLWRSYRTLAARDAYAAGHAYTGRRSMAAHVLHREFGEIETRHVHLFRGAI